MNNEVLSRIPDGRLRPVVFTLCVSLACGLASSPTVAEQTGVRTDSSAQISNYNIPAQSLGEALIRFGQQSGLQITTNNYLVESKQAPEVKGVMTAPQALAQLLADSGLTFKIDGALASVEDRETDDIILPTLEVSGTSPTYSTSDRPIEGNRFNQKLIEIPRSISVVPRSVLMDQQVNSELELLRNVSGVNPSGSYNGTYERFNLRGLPASNERSYLRDGYHYLHFSDPAWYSIEQVEVIKGPNAIDYGQTTPGGLINYVTKKPLDQSQYSVDLTAGSHDFKQAAIDLTGPLNDGRTLLYRLTAGIEEDGIHTDHVNPEKSGVAAAFSWLITPSTTLNITADFQRSEQLADPGIPLPNPIKDDQEEDEEGNVQIGSIRSADNIPVENFYGDGSAQFTIEETGYAIELQHALSDNWETRLKFSEVELIRDTRFIQFVNPTNNGTESVQYDTVDRQIWRLLDDDRDTQTARFDLRGQFKLLGSEHKLIIGADYYTFDIDQPYRDIDDLNNSVSIFNPSFTITDLPPYSPIAQVNFENKDIGFFIQDVVDFGNGWGLQLGLRRDELEQKRAFASSIPAVPSGEEEEDFSQTSSNAAITYAANQDSLIYLSYASSFEPNWSANLSSGETADPSEGEQLELGIKRAWLDSRLTTSAALFELSKTNIVTRAPNSQFSTLTGEVEVRGLELEIIGEPLSGLNLISQLTWLDTEVVADDKPSIIGNRLDDSIEKTASLWASYQLPGKLDAWRAGGGIFYTGDRYTNNENTIRLSSYTLMDAFVRYQINPQMSLQANVKNLTDKRYNASGGTTSVHPGDPRFVSLTFSATY